MDSLFASRLAAIPSAQLRQLGIRSEHGLSRKKPQDIAKLLRSSYNKRSLADKLSDETLANIFSYVLDNPFENDRVLGELSLICERWNKVIDQAPHLWTSFCFVDERMARRHSQKSGRLPLDVVIQEAVTDCSISQLVEAAVKLYRLHEFLSRVRSLEIFVNSPALTIPIYAQIRDYPAPLLTKLSLTDTCPDQDTRDPVAFSNIASITSAMLTLTSLSLQDVKLNFWHQQKGAPYNLRRLDLMYTSNTVPPPSAALIRLLHRCKQLEVLQLRSDVEAFPHGRSASFKSISLPRLQTFAFEGVGVRALSDILSAIDTTTAPASTRYDFKLSTLDLDVMAWFREEYLPHLQPPSSLPPVKLSLPRPLHHLEMSCTAKSGLAFHGRTLGLASDPAVEANVGVVITSSDIPAKVLFKALEHCPIDISQVATFEVSRWLGDYAPPLDMRWSAVLGWMPALTKLTVHGDRETVEHLFCALSPGPQFDATEVLCPGLTTLTLVEALWTGPVPTVFLLEMLTLRQAWFATHKSEECPLRVFLDHVDGWTPSDHAALAEHGLTNFVSIHALPSFVQYYL
ncbi:hypothetical protein PYCCODRAFT_1117331 [Trametes coccinea BRFM310]|uniref:Uncharacterized protein n=1 Tax=Trametes coccinea (strain BRFM310) TaxID=1353009 RepID=A0A1Y2IB13_TRAC3|nr:hypothetical protein PYCCODRAFT_1117331 [Trametes coccinea BRFM310]